MMPPVGVPRPEQSALDGLVAHLETTLDKAALASPVLRGPTMHRLNRAEYGNAIRDLFSLQVDVNALLPPDEEAFGFDNNASVLNVSTSLMDRIVRGLENLGTGRPARRLRVAETFACAGISRSTIPPAFRWAAS
jgi:hypothetical protein